MSLIRDDNSGLTRVLKNNKDKRKMGVFMDFMKSGFTPEEALDQAFGSVNIGNQTFNQTRDSGSKRDFEDIAEVLEDAIWDPHVDSKEFSKRLPRSDEMDYYKYT